MKPSHAFLIALVLPTVVLADDWTGWRGPERNGAAEIQPPEKWPAGLKQLWKVDVGVGHSGPVVADGKIYQFARVGEEEVLRCLDMNGKELWNRRDEAPYTMNNAARGHGKGPKATPAISAGRIVTLGISGHFKCRTLDDGEEVWKSPYTPARLGKKSSPLFGAATSPLIAGDRCFTFLGGHDQGFLSAYSLETGKPLWTWKEDGPAYTSPILVEVGGKQQLVTQSQQFCLGVDPATGDELWKIPYKTPYDQNSVTPVAAGERVIFSGTSRGVTAYKLNGKSPQEAWHNDDVSFYMSTPVIVGNRLYGFSEKQRGKMAAVDLETGKTVWQGPPRQGNNASVTIGGGVLLTLTTNSELVVIQPGDEYKELARYKAAASPVWAHPAVWGDRILVKDLDSLALLTWTP